MHSFKDNKFDLPNNNKCVKLFLFFLVNKNAVNCFKTNIISDQSE